MVRPLRLEFAGALYHVTSRGDRREDILVDDEDRYDWLETQKQASRLDFESWQVARADNRPVTSCFLRRSCSVPRSR